MKRQFTEKEIQIAILTSNLTGDQENACLNHKTIVSHSLDLQMLNLRSVAAQKKLYSLWVRV